MNQEWTCLPYSLHLMTPPHSPGYMGHQSGGSVGMFAHVSDIRLVNWCKDGYLTQDRSVGVTHQRTKKCN